MRNSSLRTKARFATLVFMAIFSTWGLKFALSHNRPLGGAPMLLFGFDGTRTAEATSASADTYSTKRSGLIHTTAYSAEHSDPQWYVDQLGIYPSDAQDLDLCLTADGNGGWQESYVEDEVVVSWRYEVDDVEVAEIAGPCALVVKCFWDDTWDDDDPSPEAQGRNDPARSDKVKIVIAE
jgi:hypothetical protein